MTSSEIFVVDGKRRVWLYDRLKPRKGYGSDIKYKDGWYSKNRASPVPFREYRSVLHEHSGDCVRVLLEEIT